MGRLCGAHEISGIRAPLFLRGWLVVGRVVRRGGDGVGGLVGDKGWGSWVNIMKDLKYEHESIFPLWGRVKLNFRDR